MLVGADHRRMLPITALLGALFLLWADVAARMLISPAELPIGILTAFLGVPFFLLVMRRPRPGHPGERVKLDLDAISVSISARPILDQVSLTVHPGQFAALVGPNGSGKSTLLRTVYRARRPDTGTVRLDGRDLWAMSAAEAARHTGVLMQEQHSGFEFTVAETVALGRTPHLGMFDRFTRADRAADRRRRGAHRPDPLPGPAGR